MVSKRQVPGGSSVNDLRREMAGEEAATEHSTDSELEGL